VLLVRKVGKREVVQRMLSTYRSDSRQLTDVNTSSEGSDSSKLVSGTRSRRDSLFLPKPIPVLQTFFPKGMPACEVRDIGSTVPRKKLASEPTDHEYVTQSEGLEWQATMVEDERSLQSGDKGRVGTVHEMGSCGLINETATLGGSMIPSVTITRVSNQWLVDLGPELVYAMAKTQVKRSDSIKAVVDESLTKPSNIIHPQYLSPGWKPQNFSHASGCGRRRRRSTHLTG
jgi:hypothetical protein